MCGFDVSLYQLKADKREHSMILRSEYLNLVDKYSDLITLYNLVQKYSAISRNERKEIFQGTNINRTVFNTAFFKKILVCSDLYAEESSQPPSIDIQSASFEPRSRSG